MTKGDARRDQPNIKQQRAIEALAAGMGYDAAAKLGGVTRKTLHEWRRQPVFVTALATIEAESIARNGRRLITLQEKAVSVIEAVLDGNAHPAVKLQAARMVIDASLRLRELVSVEERLSRLEEAIADVQPGTGR